MIELYLVAMGMLTNRMTGGELFDRLVEFGSYSERDAAVLMTQVSSTSSQMSL